jgi:hypothetical protein
VFECYLCYVSISLQYYKYFLYVASFQGLKSVFAGWFALYGQTRCLILRKMNAFQKDFPTYYDAADVCVCSRVYSLSLHFLYG